MRIKSHFILLFVAMAHHAFAQDAETLTGQYLNRIRENRAALTAFFQQMPKGGDLHHHYSGSVYAETYIKNALEKDYWIHPETLELTEKPHPADLRAGRFARLSALQKAGKWPTVRERLLREWSAKHFNGLKASGHDHFFDSFGKFSLPAKQNLAAGLKEIKQRAVAENVAYIEMMFEQVACSPTPANLTRYDRILRDLQANRNAAAVQDTLQTLYARIMAEGAATRCAAEHNAGLSQLYQQTVGSDTAFDLRFQNYILRFAEPADVFRQTVTAFLSADQSPYICGVNIVAPEDGETAMRDYWLHMQMFRFCKRQFPNVAYAMHAGELTMELVAPEELTWHINEAVRVAGARRIGHGVDIPYEKDAYALLDYMRAQDVPVEINLGSNAFILGVTADRHPVSLYKAFGVPIVIGSDDAGILRSSMTEQYVLLAHGYPEFSYADIKKIVYNGIRYSFIEQADVKARLIRRLDTQFAAFERQAAQMK